MSVDLPVAGETPWDAKLNAAILDIDSRVASAGGSTILSGTATPTAATGAVGDYYLDTDDRILYGPKVAGSAGGADEYVTMPTITGTISSPAQTTGLKHRFAVNGFVKGIRVYLPSGGTPTSGYEVYLFDFIGGTMMASKDVTSALVAGWNTVLFDAPVAVVAAHTYVAAYWAPSGTNNIGRDPGGFNTYAGMTTGNVRILAANEDGVQGVYVGTRDTYPTNSYAAVGVAAVFTSGLPVPSWPVALKSPPPGGTTGQVLKKLSGTDYDWGWVT